MMICAGRSNVRRLLSAVAASGIAKYFVVDSGASTTTCKNKEAFITLVPDRTPTTQADGTVTYTEGRGSIDFGEFGILPNCLYAPAFEYNLLSVPHLPQRIWLHCCIQWQALSSYIEQWQDSPYRRASAWSLPRSDVFAPRSCFCSRIKNSHVRETLLPYFPCFLGFTYRSLRRQARSVCRGCRNG